MIEHIIRFIVKTLTSICGLKNWTLTSSIRIRTYTCTEYCSIIVHVYWNRTDCSVNDNRYDAERGSGTGSEWSRDFTSITKPFRRFREGSLNKPLEAIRGKWKIIKKKQHTYREPPLARGNDRYTTVFYSARIRPRAFLRAPVLTFLLIGQPAHVLHPVFLPSPSPTISYLHHKYDSCTTAVMLSKVSKVKLMYVFQGTTRRRDRWPQLSSRCIFSVVFY
jgi:hypothetical protein